MRGAATLFSSVRTPETSPKSRDDWQTPPEILVPTRDVWPIGLDPCTVEDNPVGARAFWTAEDDGLKRDWYAARGTGIFVNYPYSQARLWATKIVEVAAKGAELIVLAPARTDTKAWHLMAPRADAICLVEGRLQFVGATAGAPFPSAVLYFGDLAKRFVRAFSGLGMVVRGLTPLEVV